MFSTQTTFIGIDPTAGHKPFTYSALDQELGTLALRQGDIEQVLAFAAGQNQAIVAVCAPCYPSKGLMNIEEVRQKLSPPPRPGRWVKFRVAEYLLRKRNIKITRTPSQEEDCPRWMQVGFILYRRLKNLGYQPYPGSGASRHYLEVYPHASYAVLIGQNPLPKHTLEGRLQRQLCLFEHRLKVHDPMRFFEEITRHRLLKGILPFENLYTAEQLDALVAAYTAWMAALQPERVTLVGDPSEGQIVLPGVELRTKY